MLKQRFLWFVNTLFSYLTDLAIRPVAEKMRREMENARDVDEMCAVHEMFVRDVEERCLLGEKMKPFQGAIQRVLEVVCGFAEGEIERAAEGGESGSTPRSRRGSGTRARARARRKGEVEEEDSESDGDVTVVSSAPSEGGDEEESDEEEEEDGLSGEERYKKGMVEMKEEFGSLVGFMKDGVRGVSRAGVMPHLEMLAEALEGGGGGW